MFCMNAGLLMKHSVAFNNILQLPVDGDLAQIEGVTPQLPIMLPLEIKRDTVRDFNIWLNHMCVVAFTHYLFHRCRRGRQSYAKCARDVRRATERRSLDMRGEGLRE